MRKFLARPSPNYKVLFSALFTKSKFETDILFFDKGREALIYGLRLLDIKPGSKILIPAYMCDSTLEILRQYGFEIVFLDIKKDFSFDLNLIEKLIKKMDVKAILAVNYFGFPSNIKALFDLCSPYDIKIIEDCCHSFLTRGEQMAGASGHVAIFSMRKMLPVSDGGGLKLNIHVSSVTLSKIWQSNWRRGLKYLFLRMVESIICLIGFPNLYSETLTRSKDRIRDYGNNKTTADVSSIIKRVQPSYQLKAYLKDTSYLSKIISQRKRNYQTIIKDVSQLGFDILYPVISDECVPQFLILIDNTGQLMTWLRKQGVGAANWPGLEMPTYVLENKEIFPVSNYFNDHLVMLPIHQSLGEKYTQNLSFLLKGWVKKIGHA